MMRSLYAGVSGLQGHQTRMDVVGNNIANVNTTGFKRGRVNFQDLISQNLKGAARPTEEVGGVNPHQVGLGVNVASIDTIHLQGSLQTTGKADDVAIQGAGFFVLREGDRLLYTRAGAFGQDEDGMLVNPANGMRVQGWRAQEVGGQTRINTTEPIEDLVIPIGSKDPARATTEVDVASNLDRATPIITDGATAGEIEDGTHATTYDIFDPFGRTHRLTLSYTRVDGVSNQWLAEATITSDEDTTLIPTLSIGGTANGAGDNTFLVQFDNFGTLASLQNAAGGIVDAGQLGVQVSFQVPETAIPDVVDPEAVNPAFLGAPGEPITQSFNLNLGLVGGTTDSTTQFDSPSSNKIFRQNGYPMGYLESFRIDQSGVITGVYSNGTNRALGQLALGSFINPGGLEKAGENAYVETINSGEADIGISGIAGKGGVISGALEMSNVDLAVEFTDMIITQRGFQANSRTIQTSDQMLQELLTLKR